MPDDSCRIAKLEAYHEEQLERFDKHCMKEDKSFDDLFESIRSIEATLSRQKGFVGGVVFVISALFATAISLTHLLLNK